MSIEAIEAVIDLIEMGAVSTQADIVKCLRSALKEPEPKREWVGLTYEDFPDYDNNYCCMNSDFIAGARWAAATLREKNT
jgi:hypothetical protein